MTNNTNKQQFSFTFKIIVYTFVLVFVGFCLGAGAQLGSDLVVSTIGYACG